MSLENNRYPHVRIYLDLDGVVYPIAPLHEAKSVDRNDVVLLHEREWWRRSVVRRLGGLGAEIVIASSWGEIFMETTTVPTPKDTLKAARALEVYPYRTKPEAVIEDVTANPAPFVWVDDDMTQEWIDAGDAVRGDIPALYVKPDGNVGLTNHHLDAIENGFLSQLVRARHL